MIDFTKRKERTLFYSLFWVIATMIPFFISFYLGRDYGAVLGISFFMGGMIFFLNIINYEEDEEDPSTLKFLSYLMPLIIFIFGMFITGHLQGKPYDPSAVSFDHERGGYVIMEGEEGIYALTGSNVNKEINTEYMFNYSDVVKANYPSFLVVSSYSNGITHPFHGYRLKVENEKFNASFSLLPMSFYLPPDKDAIIDFYNRTKGESLDLRVLIKDHVVESQLKPIVSLYLEDKSLEDIKGLSYIRVNWDVPINSLFKGTNLEMLNERVRLQLRSLTDKETGKTYLSLPNSKKASLRVSSFI